MQIAMINDRMIPIEKVGPEYLDRGTFFGDGVYEVLRSYNGKVFALEEHLERLANSLAAIEIPVLSEPVSSPGAPGLERIEATGVDIGHVRSRVLIAFEKAAIANAKIYFHITRGSGTRDHLPDASTKPNFFLTITEIMEDTKLKKEGISVSTYPDLRWKRCDIKSLNLLANVLAKRDADRKGCWEAIFVDERGVITEGSSSAFFGIVGGKLWTSPLKANILPSVTRKYVVKAARNIRLAVVEEPLTPEQAGSAEELFLGVTTKDIVPVVKFDGKTIGDGRPGRWTNRLIEEFKKFTL
jgi:D-alanine transaminase